MTSSKFGEIFLEFHTMRSFLEMKVKKIKYVLKFNKKFNCFSFKILGTRNIQYSYTDIPDTFVECFIKDNNDKIRQKKKTDIVRGNPNPSYNYVVQYTV